MLFIYTIVFNYIQKGISSTKNDTNVIVTMTTIPSRLKYIKLTILSCLYQSIQPKKIYLTIPTKI